MAGERVTQTYVSVSARLLAFLAFSGARLRASKKKAKLRLLLLVLPALLVVSQIGALGAQRQRRG